MKNYFYGLCLAFVVFILVSSLSGCATGQSRVISVNYTTNKEQLVNPKVKVHISASDERLDKDIIGDGAQPTLGKRVAGYVAFGPFYGLLPDQPTLNAQQDPIEIFRTAMTERLSKNGIPVESKNENKALLLNMAVKQFKLDYNFGKWIGEVGYLATMKRDGEVICETNINEKVTAFNVYGFESGEKALNEAFNRAIDNFDLNSCFAQCQK